MSVINLDSQVVKTIGSEIATLDTTLLQSYFPELENELSAIASNVKGDELHSILNTLNSQFSGVKAELSIALPKLENFLEEQVQAYTQTEDELDGELTDIVAKMQNISGINGTAGNGGTGSGSETTSGTEGSESISPEMAAVLERLDALEKQNAELIAQNKELSKSGWEKYVDDIKGNYDFSNGSYITEAIGGTVEVITDSVQGLLGRDGLGALVGGIGDAAGWLVKGIGKLF